jgi:hypothetical protein
MDSWPFAATFIQESEMKINCIELAFNLSKMLLDI